MIDSCYKQKKRWASFIRYGRQEHRKKIILSFSLKCYRDRASILPRKVFRKDIPSAKEQPKNSVVKEDLISAMEGLSLIPVLRVLTVFWTRLLFLDEVNLSVPQSVTNFEIVIHRKVFC